MRSNILQTKTLLKSGRLFSKPNAKLQLNKTARTRILALASIDNKLVILWYCQTSFICATENGQIKDKTSVAGHHCETNP